MLPELISSCFIVCVHSFRKRWSLGAFMRVILSCFAKKADGTFVPHKGTALYLK